MGSGWSELWNKVGVKYNRAIEKDILGLNVRDSVKIINKKHGYKVKPEGAIEVYKTFRKIVYTDRSNLLPGCLELIKILRDNHIKLAIATGASLESIGRVMDKHQLHEFFKVRFSTGQMKLPGKPNPAVYKAVIKKFKVSPKQTVVIEDALPGVKAGKGSGAKVIAVPGKRANLKDFAIADLVVRSLADKKVYKFLEL